MARPPVIARGLSEENLRHLQFLLVDARVPAEVRELTFTLISDFYRALGKLEAVQLAMEDL